MSLPLQGLGVKVGVTLAGGTQGLFRGQTPGCILRAEKVEVHFPRLQR